jgi:hypothetical protein
MLISFSDLPVFSGLVVELHYHVHLMLIYKDLHWIVSVTEVKTSLSCHGYSPPITPLIIQDMLKSVLIASMRSVAPMVVLSGMRTVVLILMFLWIPNLLC